MATFAGDASRLTSKKLLMTSKAKKVAKKSNPPERAAINVMGCAATNSVATSAKVSPPSDLQSRYAKSKNAGKTSRLKTKTFWYEYPRTACTRLTKKGTTPAGGRWRRRRPNSCRNSFCPRP